MLQLPQRLGFKIFVCIMNLILGLLTIFVFVYSVWQITLFYNIQMNFFGIYVAFYVFMIICIWMFNETTTFEKIQGLIYQIDLSTSKASAHKNIIHGDKGNMSFNTDIIN